LTNCRVGHTTCRIPNNFNF